MLLENSVLSGRPYTGIMWQPEMVSTVQLRLLMCLNCTWIEWRVLAKHYHQNLSWSMNLQERGCCASDKFTKQVYDIKQERLLESSPQVVWVDGVPYHVKDLCTLSYLNELLVKKGTVSPSEDEVCLPLVDHVNDYDHSGNDNDYYGHSGNDDHCANHSGNNSIIVAIQVFFFLKQNKFWQINFFIIYTKYFLKCLV